MRRPGCRNAVAVLGAIAFIAFALVVYMIRQSDSKMADVAKFCDAVRPNEPIEQTLERASHTSLINSRHTKVEGYLFRSTQGVNLLSTISYCDVRTRDGRVVEKKFFPD